MKFKTFAMVLIVVILGSVGVYAVTSVSYVTHQPRPSFQAIYEPEDRLKTYWPILGDEEKCDAREDIMLQVRAAGCQPTVVRSDLLAEQNVPVFCQIDALEINPLIDIEKIKSISFPVKSYPKDVVAAGFHPARAALRSRDKLLGSPLINNIGYVVVVLKKNPVEKELPEFVQVDLTARMEYEAEGAFGVGKAEFALEPISDDEWDRTAEKFKNSFWNGRYFVRLERAEPEYAIVSLYSGIRRVATLKVEKGKESRTVWVPGAFCRAGVKVAYDGFISDKDRALIEFSDGKNTDRVTVFEGSKFLHDKCTIKKIEIKEDRETGKITVQCSSGEKFELSLGNVNETALYLGEKYDKDKLIRIFLDDKKSKESLFTIKNENLLIYPGEYVVVGGIKDNKIIINETSFDVFFNGLTGSTRAPMKDLFLSSRNFFLSLDNAKIENEIIITNTLVEPEKEDKEFKEAIEALEKVADEYPSEKSDSLGSERWGEKALIRAIELAKLAGKKETQIRLMNKFVDLYPGDRAEGYKIEINRMRGLDFSDAVSSVKIDNKFWSVQVITLEKGTNKSSATFAVTGADAKNVEVKFGESKDTGVNEEGHLKTIKLKEIIDEDSVVIVPVCRENGKDAEKASLKLTREMDSVSVCAKSNIKLKDAHLERVAKVRLLPEAKGLETVTNLTVNIGIEKRAIKLSPSKTEEMIENLNKSIKKWESINEKLGKLVEGLKGACFATAGVLTVKNFLTGLSGEALARNKVMQGEGGWTQKCANMVSSGAKGSGGKSYSTIGECYLGEADNINRDVDAAEKAIGEINKEIEGVENRPGVTVEGSGGIFGGKNVDRSKAAVIYCEKLKSDYPGEMIGGKKIEEVLGNCEEGYNKQGIYGYEELREIEFNLKMRKSASSEMQGRSESMLQSSVLRIDENRKRAEQIAKDEEARKRGEPKSIVIESTSGSKNYIGEVVKGGSITGIKFLDNNGADATPLNYVAKTYVTSTIGTRDKEGNVIGLNGGVYYIGLEKGEDGNYDPRAEEVFKYENGNYVKLSEQESKNFYELYGVGRITSQESVTYNNPYDNPQVRYYEREPYKGMPAIVPFDTRNGWYAATRQTLPAFGGIGAFDASGRVTSFWLCNVGKNKKEQFFEGTGDDICQLINLNTGQPLGVFSGLDEREAKALVGRAVTAIQEAANQYGQKNVKIGTNSYRVGLPAAAIPTTQCQNFMSPQECHLLFNVCDPVICPPSRCDFGGKYPVADVIQTGIIGSTLLCLPNIKEKIFVPVCLTGIHAGIDSYLSILKSHRDCLAESLKTGQLIGICDQLYSIYLCEFFWRQLAPIAKVILPKIVEMAYGQGTRGGGEYLGVMAAWDNMQNSVSYFTQTYAVNSMKAFQARSIEEVGTPFCKAFISAKAPTDFKALVEPDSPPQFSAWFSSTKFSDATVPATAQYKVFYHIFGGKDQGVYFQVYLRSPPEGSYYDIPAQIHVASGFIGRGQYAQESKDFTAPDGYKELCVRVNNQEECGFKQVSTSFAMNYLRDSYVSEELKDKNIKSERECISGSPNLGAALTTPNIAEGAEEAILPQNYERGIVRICATQNPGSQTEPTRFVEVGYCDDTKLKCWLDKESVKNAITDNNVGVRNATLSDIEKTQRDELAKQGIILGDDVAAGEIDIMRREVKRVIGSFDGLDSTRKEVNATLDRLALLLEKLILNHQKAEVLYMIGGLKATVVEQPLQESQSEASKAAGAAASATTSSGTTESGGTTATPAGEEEIKFNLDRKFDEKDTRKNIIYLNGGNTGLFIEYAIIRLTWGSGAFKVGDVMNYKLVFKENGETKSKINNAIKKVTNEEKDYFNMLNGRKIIDNEIKVNG